MADNFRTQVDQGTVAPQGSNVRITDIFSRATPSPDAGKNAADLAQLFGAAKPVVAEVGKVWEQQKYDEGVQARLTGAMADGTAIKNGEIPFTGSQRFMEGYHVTDGKLLAQQVGQAVHARWDHDPIKSETDAAKTGAWFDTAFKEEAAKLGIDKANQFVRAGYAASIPQHINNMYARQGEAVEQFVHQDTLNKVQAEVDNLLADAHLGGPNPVYDSLPSMAAFNKKVEENLNTILSNPIYKALKPNEWREAVFNSYKAIADKTGDAGVFDSMPSWVRDSKINNNTISQAKQHTLDLALKERQRRNAWMKLDAQDAFNRVSSSLVDIRSVNNPEVQKDLSTIEKNDPELFMKLGPAIDAVRQGRSGSTPAIEEYKIDVAKRRIEQAYTSGEDTHEVVKSLIGPGGVQSAQGIKELSNYAAKVRSSQSLLTGEAYKAASGRLGLELGVPNYDGITVKLDTIDPKIRPNFVQATTDLRRQARNWIKQQSDVNGKPPSDYEFDEWLDIKIDSLVKRYGPKASTQAPIGTPTVAPVTNTPSSVNDSRSFLDSIGKR